MWELNYKENWVQKNWCFWTVVLEKTLESPLDCKKVKLVHPEENQAWIFIGSMDAEAETPILWSPDVKKWLIRKDPGVGKDWWWEEEGKTEDEMVVWHHWLDGHEFEYAPGVGDGQGSLVCYSSLGSLSEFSTVCCVHTVKGLGVVNKSEVDVSLELSCFFDDPTDVGNLISGSSAFSKTSLNIWKFKVHVLLKPGLENFAHYFPCIWDECSYVIVWAFFGFAFLCNWNEIWPFPVLWPLLSF